MNIAGPSRVPPATAQPTYEMELRRFLRELSPDEMNQIQASFAHRTSIGASLSDADVALNDFLQQAQQLTLVNRDRAVAQQIADGGNAGVERRPVQTQGTTQQLGKRAVRDIVDSESNPGPSNASTSSDMTSVPTGHQCVICRDPIYGAEISVPCGHYYDIACVTKLFESATKDETLFPPGCCKERIPITRVQPHLPKSLVATFQQKQVEFSTLKRVYCCSPLCSRFLGPLSEYSAKVYTCPSPECARRTCAKCRGEYTITWWFFRTHKCRPDVDDSGVLVLGRIARWARCPGCSHLIQRHFGCNFMTCRCRTEFCYDCGALWDECRCRQRVALPAQPRRGTSESTWLMNMCSWATICGFMVLPSLVLLPLFVFCVCCLFVICLLIFLLHASFSRLFCSRSRAKGKSRS